MADEQTRNATTTLPGPAAEPSGPPAPGRSPAGPPLAAGDRSAGGSDQPPTPPSPPPPSPPPPSPPSPPVPPSAAVPHGPPSPSSPPRRGRRAQAALAAAALMLGAGAGGAAIALAVDDDPAAPRPATSLDTPAASASNRDSEPQEALSRVAAEVLPSVVSISIEQQGGTVGGSGVIISEDGRILTNNHVVEGGGDGGSISVTFQDGETAEAEVVGRDPATDLAVIQAQDVSGLTPARFGSSADVHVGDTVLAIGSPLGLNGSVTSGIVSAVDRSITLSGPSEPQPRMGPFEMPGGGAQTTASINAVQTDAAINHGNSGGPLLNAEGEVIGINTAIASAAGDVSAQGGNIGVGFAIPIDDARDVAEQLIEDGEVEHAYLGVQIADADTGGALVGGVEPGSPADEAGLRQGDVVTRVDGEEIADSASLTAVVRSHEPGDRVTLTYTRDGDERTAEVRLATLPD